MIIRPDLEWENEYYKKAMKVKGDVAKKYLFDRGIDQSSIDFWELGWAIPGATPSNFNKDDDSQVYKKHWGRITIPIRSHNGELISISSRKVFNVSGPKYDHYPFPARRILFGLYNNKENIREEDRAIVTEGQMDVISSWQNNLKIVTSSFGAHASLDHFAILARYASNIDVLYDADFAGQLGTKMIQDFHTYNDLNVNLHNNIFLQGEDLDSWIRKNSKDDLLKLLNKTEIDILKNKLKYLL